MDRDLRVLVNTTNQLVVDSPGQTMGAMDTVLLLFMLGCVGYLVYRIWPISKFGSSIPVILALVIGAFVFSNESTSYRMDMDRGRGTLVMTTYSGKDRSHPLGTYTDPLDAFTRADMEFDRNYRRITLSTGDGQQVRPLGPDFNIMNSQFNVLGLIQRFLGQPMSNPGR